MNCHRSRSAISLFLDERLDPRQQARLNRHLERCQACSSYLETLRSGLAQLRELPLAEPSPNFEWNLRRKLNEALMEQKLLAKHSPRSAFWPRFAVSAAATLVVCLGVGTLWLPGIGETPGLAIPSQQRIAENPARDETAPHRLPTQLGERDRGFQAVSESDSPRHLTRSSGTIDRADPNDRFPLERNARNAKAADSLRQGLPEER